MEILLQLEGMSLAKKGKWGWVTFERPEALNAVDTAAAIRLERLILALGEDPDIRIVVVRGTGRAFCTGIDLKELAAGGIDVDSRRFWPIPKPCKSAPSRVWTRFQPAEPTGKATNPNGSSREKSEAVLRQDLQRR